MTIRGKTGFRRRANATSVMYVSVVSCPADSVIGIPFYDPGSYFDKKSFAGTLMDASYPSGMIIGMSYKKKRYNFVVCDIGLTGPCLRECGKDGFLVSGGVMLIPCGSQTSPRLKRIYEFF